MSQFVYFLREREEIFFTYFGPVTYLKLQRFMQLIGVQSNTWEVKLRPPCGFCRMQVAARGLAGIKNVSPKTILPRCVSDKVSL